MEHHGRLISRADLMEAVWAETAVTDNSLTQCIVEIRKSLDDVSQQLIRTVARRGYLFTAQVTTPIQEFAIPPICSELVVVLYSHAGIAGRLVRSGAFFPPAADWCGHTGHCFGQHGCPGFCRLAGVARAGKPRATPGDPAELNARNAAVSVIFP